ncbi:MAG: putative signal transducing protein [Stellaceae bacterium]
MVEGSIGAIQRRILVAEADLARARALIAEAEGSL